MKIDHRATIAPRALREEPLAARSEAVDRIERGGAPVALTQSSRGSIAQALRAALPLANTAAIDAIAAVLKQLARGHVSAVEAAAALPRDTSSIAFVADAIRDDLEGEQLARFDQALRVVCGDLR